MRHTRGEVTERTVREFSALDELVARLRPGDWQRLVPRPETRDPWTVKDALVATPEHWFGDRERSVHWPGDFEAHSAGHRRKDIEAALE